MTINNLSCFGGGFFDAVNCLVVASNYVLLYVILIVVFMVVFAVFANSERSAKNNLLLASVLTAITALVLWVIAGASGYSASVVGNYFTPFIVCSVLALAMLMYHILSDLL